MSYRYKAVTDAGIDTTGELLVLDVDDHATTVSVSIEAGVLSDFALDVDLGDGTWLEGWATYSGSSVMEVETVAARRVRIRNTTAQTSGDTADVRLGAA